MKLENKICTSIDVTPEELAGLFWSADDLEQAAFFNSLAEEVKKGKFEESAFTVQMYFVKDKGLLTPEGKAIMKEIGRGL